MSFDTMMSQVERKQRLAARKYRASLGEHCANGLARVFLVYLGLYLR